MPRRTCCLAPSSIAPARRSSSGSSVGSRTRSTECSRRSAGPPAAACIASIILVAAVALIGRDAAAVRQGRAEATLRDPRHACAPVAAAAPRTGALRPPSTRPLADGATRLRCRYRALVAELAGNGLLDDLPGKTTGEERADIAVAAPSASHSFSEATELFDDVWYGDAPTGPDDAARFRSLSERVLAEADR